MGKITLPKSIPALYATENQSPSEKIAQVKIIHPFAPFMFWYIFEFDGDDTLFVWANLGDNDCAEYGYASLQEMEESGCIVDRSFKPTPLSELNLYL
jgi:hypothetical protein